MRILQLVPCIYCKENVWTRNNQSGLALMIRRICDNLAIDNKVYVFSRRVFSVGKDISNWHLCRRTIGTYIRHSSLSGIKYWWRLFPYYRSWKETVSMLLYFTAIGEVKHLIKRVKPEVIHIHGIEIANLPYLIAVSSFRIPVVVTLHGLESFDNLDNVSLYEKITEKLFIQTWCKNSYTLTVVGSGIKSKVEDYMGFKCPNIHVILNGIDNPLHTHKRTNFDPCKKRLICVGTLSQLKNQIQVIRIMPYLQEHYKSDLELFLCGDGPGYQDMQLYVKEHNIKNISFCGRLPNESVLKLLSDSDLLVFPSIVEGFGLPIVESFSCGTPVVVFKDIDAFNDIYTPDGVITPPDRSDKSLADSIIEALDKQWDYARIQRHAEQFSMAHTKQCYESILSNNSPSISSSVVDELLTEIIIQIKKGHE